MQKQQVRSLLYKNKTRAICVALLLIICFSCNTNDEAQHREENNETKTLTAGISFVVRNVYPHDTTSYTEGLLIHEGQLYESTGSPEQLPQTKSLFGPVDLEQGTITSKVELDKQKYFGEGITFLDVKCIS